MSVSEKLKALFDAKVWEDDDMNDVAVIDALPHIVAVIEAAEAAMQTETVSALDEDDYTVWYDQPVDREPLGRALAALERALE